MVVSGAPARVRITEARVGGDLHALPDRQSSVDIVDRGERGARINLLNWDGKGRPPGLFPPPHEATAGPGDITARSAATPSSVDPGSPGAQP
jgi:nitrate reductase / nitrite oxidoreductase, beta subunit